MFIAKNKMTSVLNASVLLSTLNFVMTSSMWSADAVTSWIHGYFVNAMMKLMISNRTDASRPRIRIIAKNILAWNTGLNMIYVDFEKAYAI